MAVQAPYRSLVTVTGMTGEGCAQAVTDKLSALSGVRFVDVTLSSGFVTIASDRELTGAEINQAVRLAGYTVAD